jgi:hypothetical protein
VIARKGGAVAFQIKFSWNKEMPKLEAKTSWEIRKYMDLAAKRRKKAQTACVSTTSKSPHNKRFLGHLNLLSLSLYLSLSLSLSSLRWVEPYKVCIRVKITKGRCLLCHSCSRASVSLRPCLFLFLLRSRAFLIPRILDQLQRRAETAHDDTQLRH